MTVRELIKALESMPPDHTVLTHWDGDLRGSVDVVDVTRGGHVGLYEYGEAVYSTENRPEWAPAEKAEPYWQYLRK